MSRVGRALTVVALLLAGWVAWFGLAEATQTRGDPKIAGTRSEVVIEVETRRYRQDLETAAAALWGSCSATVGRDLLYGVERIAGNRFRLVVTPSLGRYGSERLVGCLEDLTIDRVRADVVSLRDF
jgi:hypothetical protein